MKAMKVGLAILALMFALVLPSGTATPQKVKCTTIQSGSLLYSIGHFLYGVQPLKTGFDIFGYNYQAHLFNGYYCNAYFGAAGLPPYEGDSAAYLAANPSAASHWAWPYRDTMVSMKWNDAWLSNMDCDKDGKLDRHFGFPSYIGSGAWKPIICPEPILAMTGKNAIGITSSRSWPLRRMLSWLMAFGIPPRTR